MMDLSRKFGRRRLLAGAAGIGAGGTLATIGASLLRPARADAADALYRVLVGGFETGLEGWRYLPGNGATIGRYARTTDVARTGQWSATLHGDFSGGGNYVEMQRTIPALDAREFRCWVRVKNANYLLLRVVDSEGQSHQQRLATTASDDWAELVVTNFAGGTSYGHWGGANDGVWRGPMKTLSLLIEKKAVPDGGAATLEVDDVSLGTPYPDLVVEQVAHGNVFTVGTRPSMVVSSRGDTLSWSVRDFTGAVVDTGGLAMDSTATVILPLDRTGHYRVQFTAMKDGSTIATSETTIAVVPKRSSRTSGFGFSTHFGHDTTAMSYHPPELIDMIAASGAEYVRDEHRWAMVEQSPSVFTFPTPLEEYMSGLGDAGVSPFVILAFRNPLYDDNLTPYTDEGRAAFADYAAAVLDHFGDQIKAVNVYNEFNGGFGASGPAASQASYYAPLLAATYDRVKQVRPDVTVVGCATAGVPIAWLDEVFSLGGLDHMDAVSVHPYVWPGAPEQMATRLDDLNDLLATHGRRGFPVWISEQGWPTADSSSGVTEEVQASYLVRARTLANSGVQKYTWYNFMNKGLDPAAAEDNFGVVHHTTSPMGRWATKPAFVTASVRNALLSGWHHSGHDTLGEDAHSHRYTNGTDTMRVIWSTVAHTLRLSTNSAVEVIDVMGGSEMLQPHAGAVLLSVSGEPLYVRGEISSVTLVDAVILAAPDEPLVAGDPIPLTLSVDTTGAVAGPVVGVFSMEGTDTAVHVGRGVRQSVPVQVSALEAPGTRTYVGRLAIGSRPFARLHCEVTAGVGLTLDARHVLHDDQDLLLVTITNRSTQRSTTLRPVSWSVGDLSGIETPATPLGPATSVSFQVPLAPLARPARHRWTVTLPTDDGDLSASGTAVLTPLDGLFEIHRHSVVVDGSPADLADVPAIDLSTATNKVADYAGVSDLSGKAWFTYDDENLYLVASIVDDHHAPVVGDPSNIWSGDSLQFGVAAGSPGESTAWNEMGVAVTESGVDTYRWLASSGGVGPLPTTAAAGHRDEQQARTTYEVAVPWSALAPAQPSDGLLSVALVVNENDGAGRRGWIAWGGGIASSKSAALFTAARLVG